MKLNNTDTDNTDVGEPHSVGPYEPQHRHRRQASVETCYEPSYTDTATYDQNYHRVPQHVSNHIIGYITLHYIIFNVSMDFDSMADNYYFITIC